jgi:WD40 repeat protein
MDRDGGKESCFALDRVDGFVVSPDGKTVVALTPSVSDSVQTRTPLHFIDIASGAITKVVFVPRWVDVEAGIAWTADGSRIVYATHSSLSTSAVESYRIADGMNDIISKPSEGFVRDITVSPDGRHAVFQRITGSSDAVLLTVSP